MLSRDRLIFFTLLLIHSILLFSIIDEFGISYNEAKVVFEDQSFLSLLVNFFLTTFGQNDYALRLPFIFFYLASSIVFYLLLDDYFTKPFDRLLTIAIFMILPGVNSAAILVNESIIVVFFTLLYLYLYKIRNKEHYFLLFLFLFIDNSFAILYLALFVFSLKKKDNVLLAVSLVLFAASMSIYGFDVFDKPRGYFIDTFAVLASIFSPVLFVYFLYTIYRFGLKWEIDMYWSIAATALILSLLFSLRQKVDITDFAPFLVVSIPLMVKLFMHSFRVRLKRYRKKHFSFAVITIVLLVVNFLILIFNKTLYPFFENPNSHFAYKHHVVKELSAQLKQLGIDRVFIADRKYQMRLKFYGIEEGNNNRLVIKNIKDKQSDIVIQYFDKVVARFDIIQSNKLPNETKL
ncbi:MAG TPA: hypothetical protein ENK66_03335 [Arcobacter sp.]|nr:hypothetical protein [Arcobacter sp.]